MTELEIILLIVSGCLSGVAVFYAMEVGVNRSQVKLLQAQRRMDREAKESGLIMVPVIEGLWPDLDEKERLRERVRELERGA